jgi:hypothetical protein
VTKALVVVLLLVLGGSAAAISVWAAGDGERPVARAERSVDGIPPTAERDALWLQLVLVAAGFRALSELDWEHQWNLAVPTGGPNSLNVWFTHARREPEGRASNDGVRARWGAQGLTLWASPVGDWEIRRADLDRLVRASLRVPRR